MTTTEHPWRRATAPHEDRMGDIDIVERLGFERSRDIRKLIERNSAELQRYGVISAVEITHGAKGGRPARECWLNEPQALLVAMRSDAELAPALAPQASPA